MRKLTELKEVITAVKVVTIEKERREIWLNLTGHANMTDDKFEPFLNYFMEHIPMLFDNCPVEINGVKYMYGGELNDYKADKYWWHTAYSVEQKYKPDYYIFIDDEVYYIASYKEAWNTKD